jgi:hypothetical protein
MNLPDAIALARIGKPVSMRCPAHNGKSPTSLSVKSVEGKILVHCFAGCTLEAVLGTAGLTYKDLFADRPSQVYQPPTCDKAEKRAKWPRFETPCHNDLSTIAKRRKLYLDAVELAASRGLLKVATHHGYRCWIIADRTGLAAQARRLDGELFPVGDGTKALTLPGSIGRHVIGLAEAKNFPCIMLCEGGPDLLAAHHFIWAEERERDTAAVSLLGASNSIDDQSLPAFEGKHVCIFAHADEAGRTAAKNWAYALKPYLASVTAFDFTDLRRADGTPVNDLNDLTQLHPEDSANLNFKFLLNLCPDPCL